MDNTLLSMVSDDEIMECETCEYYDHEDGRCTAFTCDPFSCDEPLPCEIAT